MERVDQMFSWYKFKQRNLNCFPEGLEFKIKKEDIDNKGRYVILEVEIQKKPYILINYYAPNLETEQVSALNDNLRKLTNFEISDDAKIIFREILT